MGIPDYPSKEFLIGVLVVAGCGALSCGYAVSELIIWLIKYVSFV